MSALQEESRTPTAAATTSHSQLREAGTFLGCPGQLRVPGLGGPLHVWPQTQVTLVSSAVRWGEGPTLLSFIKE